MADDKKRKGPPDLPNPILYGPSYPDLRLLLKQGRQILESRTNQNLRLTDHDFTDDGTYTMGRFIGSSALCTEQGILADSPGCAAFVEQWWHTDDEEITKIELRERAAVDECAFLTRLRDFCATDSQKQFFDKYIGHHFGRWTRESFQRSFEEHTAEHGPVSRWRAAALLDATVLGFPALIPEVWLAAIGGDRTDEDEKYLSEHPQRVDFVVLAKGKKWVVEIDGPSHYASYDEGTRTYYANERVYTKNLRIERALRRQGWQLHRFSNLEVKEADPAEFSRMTGALPSAKAAYITDEDLEQVALSLDAEDDIPF